MPEDSIFELNDGHVKVNRQVEGSVVEAFIPPGTAISYDSLTAILQTRLPVNHARAGQSELWKLAIAKQNVSFKLPSGETVTGKVKQVTQMSKTKDWTTRNKGGPSRSPGSGNKAVSYFGDSLRKSKLDRRNAHCEAG